MKKIIFAFLVSLIGVNSFAVDDNVETYYSWLRASLVDMVLVQNENTNEFDIHELLGTTYQYQYDNEHFVAGHSHYFQTALAGDWIWANTGCFTTVNSIQYGMARYPECRESSSYLPYYTSEADEITFYKEFADADSSGEYGGEVFLTIRQYIQPGGLPGYRKTIFKTDNIGKLAELDDNGAGWINPLYVDNFFNMGVFTDNQGRNYNWWLFQYPDFSQNDKDLSLESCVVNTTIYDEKICKETTFVIRGLN